MSFAYIGMLWEQPSLDFPGGFYYHLSCMRILLIGDIVGRPGRDATAMLVRPLRVELGLDLVIANAENAAGGKGITADIVREMLDAGVDVITMGDHVYDQKGTEAALNNRQIVRPANYPQGAPGTGWTVATTPAGTAVGVVNLLGRVFLKPLDCPFKAAEAALAALQGQASVVVVDMHAEATSEKIAMGWMLNGRVAAVCGTHTHVATADECVLSKGTAYISDVGMTGAHESVLGRDIVPVLKHFTTGLPYTFDLAERDVRLNGAVVDIDEGTGRARGIARVRRDVPQAEITNYRHKETPSCQRRQT